MINERSIDEVKNRADVVELIGSAIKLTRKGASYQAHCPFHDEKSPSFSVTPSKGIYKCYGCGKSGDAIQFVIDYHRKSFIEAIEFIADFYNITLEHTEQKRTQEQIDELKDMHLLVQKATNVYQEKLFALDPTSPKANQIIKDLMDKRQLSYDSIIEWQLGYAPNEWRTLSDIFKPVGKVNLAIEIGLLNKKEERFYDVIRDRISIPIHNHKGQIIGVAGRDMSGEKGAAKYINPKESAIYVKFNVLYGLHRAAKSIRERNKAYLVEGYFDVIAMHQNGHENTVATCGTALTGGQCQLLSKYTKNVVVLRDSDNAGKKAANRDVDILLEHGFNVEVLFLPDGEDPDSYLAKGGDFNDYAKHHTVDGIYHKCVSFFQEATTPNEIIDAISEAAHLLSLIPNDLTRNFHVESISKTLIKAHIKPAAFAKKVNDLLSSRAQDEVEIDEKERPLPSGVDPDEYMQFGFYELVDKQNTGFWFTGASGHHTKLTNFVIKPLFHIYSKQENRRMIEITNGYDTKIIEMQSKSLISLEQFCSAIFDEGFFITEGGFSRAHLLKIINKIGNKFPLCYELKTLGWQPEGFWAYSNNVWHNGNLLPFDELGVVEVDKQKFISFSVSKVQQDVRAEEDIYENDRFLSYKKAEIDFKQWAELMTQTYNQNGWVGVAWSIVTLFRDIVFKVTKVPHLYAYGGVGAGKSEFGDSISNLFFNQMPAFNLNQGTDFAFFNRMERFRNTPNALNEFDEYAINEVWFRAIKAAYDGEGREKGRGQKEKTRSQKITCSILLMGQYLSTKDDNSVLTRSIPLAFKEVEKRPEIQTQAFVTLKKHEAAGLSSILVEILQLRELVKKNFATVFSAMVKQMSDELTAAGKSPKTRIVKNLCAPLAMVAIVSNETKMDPSYTGELLQFPFEFNDYYLHTKDMIVKMSDTISESNALSEFWKYCEYLLDRELIKDQFDFKVEARSSVVIVRDGEKTEKHLETTKKLLFIRLGNIHKIYQNEYRKNTGKNGLNEQTLITYIKDQPYFIGMNPGSNFTNDKGQKVSTSSYVLDYEAIKISLERTMLEDEREEIIIKGQVFKDAALMATGDVVSFSIGVNETVPQDNNIPKHQMKFYSCYMRPMNDWRNELTNGQWVEITGMLSTQSRNGKTRYNIDVANYSTITK